MVESNDVITTVKRGGMEVEVARVQGLIGYRFNAVGVESMPLAVDLALVQAQKGVYMIDRMLGIEGREQCRGN